MHPKRLPRHLSSVIALLIATLFATGCPGFGSETGDAEAEGYPLRPTYADVKPVLDTYCNECHGRPPANDAPSFLRLDVCESEEADVQGASAYAERIVGRAVDHDTGPMPPVDYPLEPGDAEDELLVRWRDLGAPCTEAELPPAAPAADAGLDT